MKSPLSKLLPELERTYKTALENLAATHLHNAKIKLAVHRAAESGHKILRLPMPDGIDLRGTDGAELFKEWTKQTGLTVEWLGRTATLEGGRQAVGYDVELSW